MKKLIFIAALVLSCLSAQTQTWCSWSFQYDFNIKSNKIGDYQLDSLEILLNEPLSSSKLSNIDFGYTDSISEYSIKLAYGCISCGYNDARHPPTFFLRLFITDNFPYQKFSIIIPITFDNLTSDILMPYKVNLGKIDFKDYLLFNFSGIRVKSSGEVYKFKKGEYLFPQTEKLIKIKKNVI